MLINFLKKYKYTYFNHVFGLKYKYAVKNAKFMQFYKILSVNENSKGEKFVSSFEARKYPFYAI